MSKSLALCVSSALLLFAAAGCGGGDTPSIEDSCRRSCTKALAVMCPADTVETCPIQCEQKARAYLVDHPECKPKVEKMFACQSDLGPSGWVCDAGGNAAPRDGVCVSESVAAFQCA